MFHLLPSPSPPPPPLPIILFFTFSISLLPVLNTLPVLPNPDTSRSTQQTFNPNPIPSPKPVTIPSFPEQSTLLGCPVHLPDELFPAVKASCTPHQGELISHTKCCPVLASWLYSVYSSTALRGPGRSSEYSSIDMPVLPDDSEMCVDGLEDIMRNKGLDLIKPNETCGVVYCYCGIRLRPLSCPQAFGVSEKGAIVGDKRVSKLERDCLSSSNPASPNNPTRNRSGRCSKCLHSLYSLKKRAGTGSGNLTASEHRTQKMRGRDCELMGLTWLLNKDRDAYMSTVTEVMRALMLNSDNSDPLSCTLRSDGLPLAVGSTEIDHFSSSHALHFSSPLLVSIMYLSFYF